MFSVINHNIVFFTIYREMVVEILLDDGFLIPTEEQLKSLNIECPGNRTAFVKLVAIDCMSY